MTITLEWSVAEMVAEQTAIGNYQSPEDLVYDALKSFVSRDIEQGISEAFDDINASRFEEMNQENMNTIITKSIQWQ